MEDGYDPVRQYDASGSTQGPNFSSVVLGGFVDQAPPALPTVQTTTLDNGMVSQIQWSYNLNNPAMNDSVLTEERVYDYGNGAPGTLLKRTDYTWLHRDNPVYYGWPASQYSGSEGAHICDRKTSETVYDGSGKMMAQTKYVYDYGNPATYGAAGLLTSVSKWRSTDGAWLTTNYTYERLGLLASKTDPKGNVTQYSYSDNYANAPSGLANTYAFLTQTTDSLGHKTQNQYYWGSGLVAASCGENFSGTCKAGLTSGADYASYTYDLMGRKTSTATGDGGLSTTCFSEFSGGGCYSGAYPLQVTSMEAISPGATKVSAVILDGEARTVRSELLSDPNCPGGSVNVDTTYDLDGRKSTVTNPYCSNKTSAPTTGTTTYAYDGLSRTTTITHPDGTSASNTYTGRAVLSADEGNGTTTVQRISQSDALGRLINVCEVTSSTQNGSSGAPAACGLDYAGTGFLTTYGYDAAGSYGALENLTSVSQGGVSRSFIYDSLSELKSAINPESGATTYNYDNDGNLTSKTSPLENQSGTATVTTTYSYDALNRLTGKSYSDGTAAACFEYDQNSAGLGIGRLSTEWTQAGTCSSAPPSSGTLTQRSFSAYDPMGRVSTDQQCAALGNCGASVYTLGYTYDLAGDVATFSNGLTSSSALSYTNQYNSADRLSSLTDTVKDIGLISATGYTPAGALSDALIGPGISFHRDYNSRLLPIDEVDTVGTTPGTATVQITGAEQLSGSSTGSITFSGAEQSVSYSTISFTISGSEQSTTSGSTTTYDEGALVALFGTGSKVLEGVVGYQQGSTPASLATALASSINANSGGIFTASASGAIVTVWATSPGAAYNLPVEITGGHNPSFSSPSFTLTPNTPALTSASTSEGGLFIVQIGAGLPIQILYGQNSTPANLASELASLLDCLDGQEVNSVAEGATVIMTSCAAGTNTNYAISAYADGYGPTSIFPQNSFGISASGATMSVPAPTYSTGSFIFDGAEQSAMVNGSTVYDNGVFFIFTQGPSNPPLDVPYEQGSTPSSLALYVAQHIPPCSVSGEEFSAVANGPVVILTSCQPGSNSNYPLDGYLTYYNPTFAKPSFSITDSGATMTGGNSFNRVYDSGTVSLTINGTEIASTTYGSASTPASIASGLVTSGASNGLVTLQANGANLTMTANGDGTQTNYTYAINVVSNSSIFASEPSFSSSTPSGTLAGGQAAPLYNWSISSYAPDGDVLAMTDSVMGAWTYTYDAMNRLTSGTASAGVDAGLTLGWTYDRYGNRWAQNATGSGSATATQGQLSFTGNNNRIDGWLYDAAGNLLYDNINHYTYDAENRIATLNGAPAYIYDAEGRRVAKLGAGGAVTASYILGLGGEQLSEINAAGQWVHSNVFAGGGRLLATYEGPGGAAKAGYHFHSPTGSAPTACKPPSPASRKRSVDLVPLRRRPHLLRQRRRHRTPLHRQRTRRRIGQRLLRG